MNNLKQKIEKVLIIACLFYLGIIIIANSVVFITDKVFYYAIPVVIFFIILYIIADFIKIKSAYFAIGIFILAFALKVIIAAYFNASPKSDFANFYNAALKAANGDFSFSTNGYFSLWAYQMGIVIYYAGLIKLFGRGILALKIVNCLFIAGVNALLYLIARKFVSEKYARFIALVYLFYPATFFLASVLTNQHVSNFLILAGVYIFISKQKMPKVAIVLSASLIALGNAMRPQAIVVVLAIAGSILFEIMTDIRDKKTNIKLLKTLSAFLIIYIILTQGLSFGVKALGLNDNGLKNTFPLYKFAVGLNDKTYGTYSQEDANVLTSVRDPKLRNEKALKIIKERTSNPKKLTILLIAKPIVMWAGMDISTEFGFRYLKDTGVDVLGRKVTYNLFTNIIQGLEKAYYIIIFFMASFGISVGYKRYKNLNGLSIFVLIILFNFVIYTLIEIQPRYRDFQMIFIFITAAIGLELFEKLDIVKNRNLHLIHINNKTE